MTEDRGPVLEVEDVVRTFGRGPDAVRALDGVSFQVGAGELVGLLGVNGAGKTTLLKIVSTLLLPTSGRIRVSGVDVVTSTRRARELFTVVFGGDRGLYGRLSARSNARYFGTLSGVPRRRLDAAVDDALARVGLASVADRQVHTFSKGMHQRLHLAIGLVSRPGLFLLDEPTVGLDPLEAERLRDTVAEIRDQGATVVLTSHYLKDIERLASRVVLLQGGRVSHDVPLQQLLASAPAARVTLMGLGPAPDLRTAPVALGGQLVEARAVETVEGGRWRVVLDVHEWTRESVGRLMDVWPDRDVTDVSIAHVTLEDVFTQIAEGSRA